MTKICTTELSFPVKKISLTFNKDVAADIMRNGVKQENSIENF